MDPVEKCSSCAAPLPKSFNRTCTRCGWDNQVGMRKCVKCKDGVVVLSEAIGYGTISGVLGVGGLILCRFLGIFLGGALVCAIGSLCGLITAVFMKYKCGGCNATPVPRLLSKDEQASIGKRRIGFVIGSVLLGVAAIVLFFLFIGYMNWRFS
ncbi:MAG: hypothetical protein HY293_11980 [Planctomycetes bacterium]|nr:hypothetical protein [Planctomycetota bacterium]